MSLRHSDAAMMMMCPGVMQSTTCSERRGFRPGHAPQSSLTSTWVLLFLFDMPSDPSRNSVDYVIRSVIAGGVAGGAVRARTYPALRTVWLIVVVLLLGQDGGRAPRAHQDPLPDTS